jgi:hypothetical protein
MKADAFFLSYVGHRPALGRRPLPCPTPAAAAAAAAACARCPHIVAARGKFLSGFDQDCAAKVVQVMASQGTRFLRRPALPVSIRRHFVDWGTPRERQRFRVTFADGRAEMYALPSWLVQNSCTPRTV